jgi:competence protein ComEC
MRFKKWNGPPLVPLCCLLCLGILTGSFLRAKAFIFFYFLIPVGLAVLFKVFKRESPGWSKGVLFFLLGAVLIHRVEFPSIPLHHILSYSNQGKVWVVGKVVTLFPENQKKKSLVLAVKSAGKIRSELLTSTGRIKVTIRDADVFPAHGDLVTVRGSIRPFRNFANPGGFDYARFMKRKGLMASLYCRGPDFFLEKTPLSPPWTIRFIRGISRLRNDFSLHIQSAVKDQNSAAMLNALVLGKRKMLTTDLQNTFSRSGAAHVLAISGLHLSIVATLFFFLFQKFFSLFIPLLVRGLARKGAALMTLLPLAGYALISGFSPATQRALIMVSVVMFSLTMERENITLNSLAAAGIGILIFQPGALFSISFQLSFAAVFFIISGLELARRHGFPSLGHIIFNKIVLFFLVSLLAIAGTQPLVMRYFNMASFAGMFTNGVTIPVVGFGVLPLGLFSLLLFPISTTLSAGCLVLAGVVATPCIAFLTWVCHVPGAWSRTVTPDMLYLVAWYLVMLAIYMVLRGWEKKWAILLGGMAFLLVVCKGTLDVRERFFNQTLGITVLDVGQGNSALIHLPGGSCFLVDGGGFSSNSMFDTGRYLVAPYLWRQNILTLDGVVLTHPEADHMNGLLYILENFRVKLLYKNEDYRQTRGYKRLMALAKSRGVIVHRVDPTGEVMVMGQDVTLRFFPGFSGEVSGGKQQKNYNDNSLVLGVKFRAFSMLFAGDIMVRREAVLSSIPGPGEYLKSTLLMVPHHGSSTSSTSAFLDRVQPEMALVSCGWHNRFKFPHSRVLGRYQERKIPFLRTDWDGALHIVSDGKKWHVQTTRRNLKCRQQSPRRLP